MKTSFFYIFIIWFYHNLYSQKVCCEKPEDVLFTLIECSRTSDYDRLRLLSLPNGEASSDVYRVCNPGKEYGGKIVSKTEFSNIYKFNKNNGNPKTTVEFIKDQELKDRKYYPCAIVNGWMHVIKYNGCWYWADS